MPEVPDSTAILWATWVTGIAVIGAVVAAVWFALRDRWTHLTGAADVSRTSDIYGDADVLIVELANRGISSVAVTGAYWRIGWFKPDTLAVSIPKLELLSRIESQHGTFFPIVLSDVHRTLICNARERKLPVTLIVRTTTGGEVRCGLTRAARQWISSTGI